MEVLTKKVRSALLIFMGFSLIFSYAVSVMFMDHGMMDTLMRHASVSGHSIMAAHPVSESEACVNFHIGLLRTLSESFPQLSHTVFEIIGLAITYIVISLVAVQYSLISKQALFQYQRLKPVSLLAFLSQLGFWLTLTEKKSPAYAFALA